MSDGRPEGVHLQHHPRGSLRRAGARFALLIVILVGSILAARFTPLRDLLTLDHLRALLERLRGAWWSPFVHVGLCLFFGMVGMPATPFLMAGAAIFGAVWGTAWNFLGILLASVAGYGLAHLLGRDFVERIGGAKLRRAEKLLRRRSLLPLVAIRFVPVPFALVNSAAAMVGVPFWRFFAATALGLLPPIAIWTYAWAAWLEAATGDRSVIVVRTLIFAACAALVVILPIGIRRRLRHRRLRELRARRAARPRAGA